MSPEMIRMYVDMAWPVATGLLIAGLILIVGWMVSKWTEKLVRRVGERGKLDIALSRFLAAITRYTILAASFIAALGQAGIETTSLVAVFASAGLAVGLALQGSLANFAAGVMILFFRPFHIEDLVQAGGQTGRVKDIGLFATTMTTRDNEKIIVPNASITSSTITNYTTLGQRRGAVDVGVAYGADLRAVQAVALKAAASVDKVLVDPPPTVAFVEMASSSLNFKLFVWSLPPDYLDMLHEVRSAVYDGLNAEGIEIPFPQIVVHKPE